jgi:predicted nucleotide-binding protein with TIR-like domain/uncharacterized protein DUF6879
LSDIINIPKRKPRLFIGSSSEGLPIANSIQELLTDTADVTVWNQSAFELSATVIEGLSKATQSFDCALFVFSPSDVATIRSREYSIVRDNVVFELGLFGGALGRERCFIVQPSDEPLRLPSDLLGIVVASYEATRPDGNLVAALGPACNRIRRQLPATARIDIEPLRAALDRVSESNDPVFGTVATKVLRDQADLVANRSVEYIIAHHPDCLRGSIARAHAHVRAAYFIDRKGDADYLLCRKMLSWLEYNATVAARPGLSFARLLIVRDQRQHVQRYWATLEDISTRQKNAGIEVRILNGNVIFDPTIASEDFVLVDDSRVHVHTTKLASNVPYTTARVSVDPTELVRRKTQWDRMWDDAVEAPTPLSVFYEIRP